MGETFVEGTRALARRATETDVEYFNGGEPAADVRLEMRGILVGVSFDMEFIKDDEVGSCEVFAATFPADGEPAMVGN